MRVLGVIPARFASTRLPGKPLVDLGGETLVMRVVQAARSALEINRLVVATDHEKVRASVEASGAEVLMTSPDHPSGSDRCAEVLQSFEAQGQLFDLVANIQGDEPFLPGEAMDKAIQIVKEHPPCQVATLAVPLTAGDREDPHVVKLRATSDGVAEAFGREPDWEPTHTHVGFYVFRRDYLVRFVDLPQSESEKRERLEQLRILDDGVEIRVAAGAWPVLGVDTPEDLELARKQYKNRFEAEV